MLENEGGLLATKNARDSISLDLLGEDAQRFDAVLAMLGVVQTNLNQGMQVKKYLGSGAFSDVYLAELGEGADKKCVAVKVSKQPLTLTDRKRSQRTWRRMKTEVDMLRRVQGDSGVPSFVGVHILRARFSEGCNTMLAVVTEFLPITLTEMRKRRSLSEHDVRTIIRGILQTLAHMHSRGIAHQDVKVSNIMLRSDDLDVCLVDFGLCALYNAPRKRSQDVVGTPGYVAPEHFEDLPLADRRPADIYSTGIVLHNLTSARPAFYAKSTDEILDNNRTGILDLTEVQGKLSAPGFDVLHALLSPLSHRPNAGAAMQMDWFKPAEQSPLPDMQESPLQIVEFPDKSCVNLALCENEKKMETLGTEDTTVAPASSSGDHAFNASLSSDRTLEPTPCKHARPEKASPGSGDVSESPAAPASGRNWAPSWTFRKPAAGKQPEAEVASDYDGALEHLAEASGHRRWPFSRAPPLSKSHVGARRRASSLEEPRGFWKKQDSSSHGVHDTKRINAKGLFRRGFLGRGAQKDEPARDDLTEPPFCCSDDEGDCRSLNVADKQSAGWFSPRRVPRLRKRQGPVVDPMEIDVEVLDSTEQDGLDARNRLGTWSYFTRGRAKSSQTRKPIRPEGFANSPDASPKHAAPRDISSTMNRSASTSL
jgi:serine/threonine protein kinase